MKKFLFVALQAFMIVNCSAFAQINKVLVIGIDGCRPDAAKAANTPNIDALVANSTYSWDALNDRITVSGPGWSSMLTGVWPAKHGVTNNAFTGSDYVNYPHFFQRIEEHDSSLHTVSICQWHPINNQIAVGSADTIINVADNSIAVRDAAVIYLTLNDPDALFLHFDDVDHAGHGSGFSPSNPAYITSIETVDDAIGGVMTALTSRPTYSSENWAIILSTDHGGKGTSHGGNSPEEENIFIIVSGDSIPNAEVKKDSTLTAVPPTFNCLSDSVELYFDGDDVVHTSLDTAFNFGTTQDFTVECRVRTNSPGDVAIVTDKDWDSGVFKGWVFSFQIGTNLWKVNVGDGSGRVDLNGNLINDGDWHTLSATFDRDGFLKIFEDGVLLDSSSIAGIGDIYSGFPISIGADAFDSYGYDGYISEVRIFKDLVADSSINIWSCKKLDPSHPNISNVIGYWRLTEGGGATTVINIGSSGGNGTLVGPKWESADDTTFSWEYDFSATPRQVDVAVSALEHLCIPIDSAWSLDGNIFGTSCDSLITYSSRELIGKVNVYPNPSKGEVYFDFNGASHSNGKIEIISLTGELVIEQPFEKASLIRIETGIPSGLYIYKISLEGNSLDNGLLMIAD